MTFIIEIERSGLEVEVEADDLCLNLDNLPLDDYQKHILRIIFAAS
jgi:hypothetical protein